MKKLVLLTALSLLVITTSQAQLFQWAKSLGGESFIPSVAAGNSILASTGFFHKSITIGHQTFTSPDSMNPYLAVYDHQGNGLWGKHIIGQSMALFQVTVDQNQHVIVAGAFEDSLYIDGLIFKGTSAGAKGVYIVKYDTFGNLLWARSSVISQSTQPIRISLDADGAGNIYLAGTYSGSITFGTHTFNSLGSLALSFLVKYDASGTFQWGFNPQPGALQASPKVKASDSGDVYFGFLNTSSIGPQNGIYLNKVTPAGTLVWDRIAIMQNFTGNSTFDIATDNLNNAYITAEILQDITVSNGTSPQTVSTNGILQLVLAKINPAGNWNWITSLASGYFSGGWPSLIYCAKKNKLILAGTFGGTINFNNTVTLTNSGNGGNTFIAALDTAGTIDWTNLVSGKVRNIGLATANGDYFISGDFSTGNASFNSHTLATTAYTAGYLAKISDNANKVSGTVYLDSNGNGIKDTNEQPFTGLILETSPSYGVTRISNTNGDYAFFVPAGNVTVNVPNSPRHHILAPASYALTFTGQNQTQTGKDFALQPIPNRQDVQVTVTNLTPARPGFDIRYRITYRNMGTTTVSDTISLKFDATYLTLIGATVAPATQTTGRLQWPYQNLQPYQERQIDITFNVDNSAILGSTLQTIAAIKPFTGDQFIQDNHDTINFVVTGAYDPNDKLVSYEALSPAQVANGQLLDYVIRFQNTGTDTAFTVIVRDSISNKLHMPSFELLSASHPYTFRFMENGMAEWRFDNILLPDSNRNEPASHGFIRYRIKPKTNLVLGDEIKERAAIYFDFNAPVMTNYAITRIANPLSIKKPKAGLQPFQLYPNPAQNYVMVAAELKKPTAATVRLVNILGQTISEVKLPANNQLHYQLPLNNLPKGVYIVQLETEHGRQALRLVVQ